MTADRIAADDLDALTGAALFGCLDWREEREPVHPPGVSLDDGAEVGEDDRMRGTIIRVVAITVSVAALVGSASQQPPFRAATGQNSGDTIDAAVRVFVARGLSVASKDRDAGLLVGTWTLHGPTGRTRWVVRVDGDVFVVDRQCHFRRYGDWGDLKEWEPCGPEVSGPSEEAAAIARDIELEMGGDGDVIQASGETR